MFYKIFHSPKVKESTVVIKHGINKRGMYQLPHELQNNLRN